MISVYCVSIDIFVLIIKIIGYIYDIVIKGQLTSVAGLFLPFIYSFGVISYNIDVNNINNNNINIIIIFYYSLYNILYMVLPTYTYYFEGNTRGSYINTLALI